MPTTNPKDEVRRLLESLPDSASYEDIHYHIYVQQKIGSLPWGRSFSRVNKHHGLLSL